MLVSDGTFYNLLFIFFIKINIFSTKDIDLKFFFYLLQKKRFDFEVVQN